MNGDNFGKDPLKKDLEATEDEEWSRTEGASEDVVDGAFSIVAPIEEGTERATFDVDTDEDLVQGSLVDRRV